MSVFQDEKKSTIFAIAAAIMGVVYGWTAYSTPVLYRADAWITFRILTWTSLGGVFFAFFWFAMASTHVRNHRFIKLSCFALLFVGMLALDARTIYDTQFAAGLDVHTAEPAGDPGAYRVVAGYETARDFASPEAELLSIEAEKVASNGTLDVFQPYEPKVTYVFWGPDRPQEGHVKKVRQSDTGWPPRVYLDDPTPKPPDLPIGAGRPKFWDTKPQKVVQHPFRQYQVVVEAPKKRAFSIYDLVAEAQKGGYWPYRYAWERPMKRDWGKTAAEMPKTIAAPKCTFERLWKVAQGKGAPADAVAWIRYDSRGYRFKIDEIDVDLAFDSDCKLLSIVRLHYVLKGLRGTVTLQLDGKSIGEIEWIYELGHHYRELLLPPGEHEVRAQYGRSKPVRKTFTVGPGEKRRVQL